MSSMLAHRLAWKVRALNLLRRTTRPRSLYPASILNAGEVKVMESAYLSGWTPKEFCRLIVKRDRLEPVK